MLATKVQVIDDQSTEGDAHSKGIVEIFEPSVHKRENIATRLHMLTQAAGINPIMSYGTLIFKDITNSWRYSILFISGVNFLSAIPAIGCVESYGRRTILNQRRPELSRQALVEVTHSHATTSSEAATCMTTKTLLLSAQDREDEKTLVDARVSSAHITNVLNERTGCKLTPQPTRNLIRSIK
ncbi:Sugar transporter [Phytophthora cinnamomi]|uniref:Sugar transporter n=1 Tax=Phytophthora cinnamomi TaxID=4785 RepID=UPI003559A217|nr:Sugar transporter [Phytophthora cinnamomi]